MALAYFFFTHSFGRAGSVRRARSSLSRPSLLTEGRNIYVVALALHQGEGGRKESPRSRTGASLSIISVKLATRNWRFLPPSLPLAQCQSHNVCIPSLCKQRGTREGAASAEYRAGTGERVSEEGEKGNGNAQNYPDAATRRTANNVEGAASETRKPPPLSYFTAAMRACVFQSCKESPQFSISFKDICKAECELPRGE